MAAKFGKLEQLIGYTFEDAKLLERALTHRSWAYENTPGEDEQTVRDADNESLEFVGDSVIGLVVAEQLFRRNPQATEGDLTLMKHNLVSGPALAGVAEDLGIGEFIRLGGSERRDGRQKQSLLANTFEAVVGAVFLEAGYVATRVVVTRLMEDRLQKVTVEDSLDYKSRLQTELQAQKQKTAEYKLVRTDGPPHARTFYVEAVWEGGSADGEGNSIKAAEMMAAEKALDQILSKSKRRAQRVAKG